MKTAFFLAALLLAGCGGGRDGDGMDDVRTAGSLAVGPTTATAVWFSGVPLGPAQPADSEPFAVDGMAAAPVDGLEPQPLERDAP